MSLFYDKKFLAERKKKKKKEKVGESVKKILKKIKNGIKLSTLEGDFRWIYNMVHIQNGLKK